MPVRGGFSRIPSLDCLDSTRASIKVAQVRSSLLDVHGKGGEATGWSGLYRAPRWDWAIE
jgi:hypothetical protein